MRSALFSADQMEQHGAALAAEHRLAPERMPDRLLERLAANESVLTRVCNLLTAEDTENRRTTPAGDWLLDNFHLIEEQILTAKRHLPKDYSRELPCLADGPSAGRPRVYDIALEAIAHGDGHVDEESLSRFVTAYQTVTALTLGELWAIPIMLRLAVIENLRRVSVRVSTEWADRNLAGGWADQMIETAEQDPKSLILLIADMARSNPPMVSAFVAELVRRLQGRGPALALPLSWLEQRLSESGQTIEQLVRTENQQQAADQVSISNSIGSLRMLDAIDWQMFVEALSVVEQTLLDDPSGVYGHMDFATRDRYRHAAERIAKQGRLSEGDVAREAIALAREAAANDAQDRAAHVGFHLIDKGLPALERKAGVHNSIGARWRHAMGRFPLLLYLGAIGSITLAATTGLLVQASATGASAWILVPTGVLSLLAISQLAVTLVNWLSSLLVTARPLPRMGFADGIPSTSRTLVVVPTMLTSASDIERLIEALEVRFLANRDECLHFGLLTDLADAAQEALAEDESLVRLAQERIEELNRKYASRDAPNTDDTFFLFHRPRRWNPQERVWMGYERKRGKLEDLNALLRGATHDGFSLIVGDPSILQYVKYVITLDSDTQLPRDAARQFVGAMAHPLNRPRYDAIRQRIVEGHGILQPSVASSLPGSNRSHYARLFGGEAGIDPYTRAISDIYQDLFGEGSFIGKGIYDVDAFGAALGGRFPENQVLSHDLLEGCYARSGLLSDVPLYEETPARYAADVKRRHRWIRGDWQIARWLLWRAPREQASQGVERQTYSLSMLSRWKLLDNLRRSLFPATLTLLLLIGWTLLSPAWWWTPALLGIVLIPALCGTLLDACRKPSEVLLRQHLAAVAHTAVQRFKRVAFELACLPHEAWFSLDAIVRTIWRMRVTHRHLLEWKASSEVEREASGTGRGELAAYCRSMWIAPAIAVTTTTCLALRDPSALAIAAPILLLWLVSPAIAWWISRPLARHQVRLSHEQTRFLRVLARRTWAFFERVVGPRDHWLPPDNMQEGRANALAHRTSPTNIGLALLANLSAYDFGYLPAGRLLERTAATLGTMGRLERHQGHFYNWYDTLTLQPLPPLYLSAVDSGNLAGHLLTLRAGLLALADDGLAMSRAFDGMRDTLGILETSTDATITLQLETFRDALNADASTRPQTLAMTHLAFERLADQAMRLATQIDPSFDVSHPDALNIDVVNLDNPADSAPEDDEPEREMQRWAHALARQCIEARDELSFLAPWLTMTATPNGLETFGDAVFDQTPTLRQLAAFDDEWGPRIARHQNDISTTPEQHAWLGELRHHVAQGSARAADRIAHHEALARQAYTFTHMEYGFLFDKTRQLLAIGYNVTECRVDASYYDLLASEARLASFVAIAQGQLPQESWFSLGRLLTATGAEPVLLSWSGSMFEYLMPMLVMPSYENTLLDQTCKAAVARQIEYGKQRGVPWGISESGYNTLDAHLNYQYRAFGVPGLGLKRGLAEDLVIAPYATVMALMVAPEAACQNLQRLASEGVAGEFGFFEAVDYTPARQRRGQAKTIVRSYMAHHQGMSLLALAYRLLEQPMQRRFESDRRFQASMLLLQERIPRATALFSHTARLADVHSLTTVDETPIRVFDSPDTPIADVQLLSNGRYHVMVTNAGGGYSRWKDIAVTRWREDGTRDDWGTFCYVRDVASGTFWSSGHQPTLRLPRHYEAIFSAGRAEFRRHDTIGTDPGDIETYTEIVVSPEDDIELRRVRLTNRSSRRREIDVTSYAEVVIAPPASDDHHSAFSNLFVQTEILRERHAILCTRRPRSPDEQTPWMLHLMAVHGARIGDISYETDRSRFIGRTRSSVNPLAMHDPAPLSGTAGSVLDPIVAIRYRLVLDPLQSVSIDIVTGIADSRDTAAGLIEKYQDRHLADRVFDLTWTHRQVELHQLNASEADSQLYARLASYIIHANAALRADANVLAQNRHGQSGLWGYAISGDLPIVLLQIADSANIDLVRQLVQAHAYWRLKGLAVDLVIWNEDHAGYRQQLQDRIMGLIASSTGANVIDRPGGIFVRPVEQISREDRILFQSVARVIITDARGTLAEQLDRRGLVEARAAPFIPSQTYVPSAAVKPPVRDLILCNGLGGFTADGREYVITLTPGQTTPAPWVNVLANPHFGTVVSENGSAYTWSENAHEFRLTPWHNDPVSDASGEALYLRDEESGHVWSPTPLPSRAVSTYVIRHGFGYSVFDTQAGGIHSQLWVYVALDAAVKFSVLKVRNASGRSRKLSATGYVEWVLGDLRAASAMHVSTDIAPSSGAILARNPYNAEFSSRVAFFDNDDPGRTLSGDRQEFLGRNGTLQHPAALQRKHLSGKVGAGLDPCAAIQSCFDLADGQEREIVFRLGVGRDTDDASALIQRFHGPVAASDALDAARQHWRHTLGTVQVETPDPSIDVMANGWLVYQTLACRVWARSGYYQSGGAFGFRDQLQDTMALIHADPERVRNQLLLCASRQFREGDVQHWWHPPTGRGVRTHCSDDYLWLPLATCRYVLSSGDTALLDEQVRFLEGRPLNPDEESYYDLPGHSDDIASLYQHCVRAIEHGLRFGVHGLPLIGSGDWNDGMDLVGSQGKGESVWLGFFLCEVLGQFRDLARAHGDPAFAERCEQERTRLMENLELHGWDGEWYRRAYFDDGSPLGSTDSQECRIDSISQSWAALSGAGDPDRVRRAMNAVDEHLVRHDDDLIQLLDPPFDIAEPSPGYIRGYVPGVRENGGQYTHAAIWTAMAFAKLGERERAWEAMAMINPVNHSQSDEAIAIYKVEPYVIAADVYALHPHTGRGGWSWYTGSAGWMYRLILESLLGLRREAECLRIVPCIPATWTGFTLHYRYRETSYHIAISHLHRDDAEASAETHITLDGVPRPGDTIPLVDDRHEHRVDVTLTASSRTRQPRDLSRWCGPSQ